MKQQQLIKVLTCLFLYLAMLLPGIATAQSLPDNVLLQQMADADQLERQKEPIDWTALNRQDSIRLHKVFELIANGEVQTAKDYFNAGVVLQHGADSVASALAVNSFATAIAMDSSLNRWWYAAAVDRDLMRRDKHQLYGTQFIKACATCKWSRYKIDSTQVSDEQRRYYSVETLAEQAEKERLMNRKSLSDYYKETGSLDQTIQQIKLEFKQGRLSAYSLEAEVNQLGYELLGQDKQTGALAIFKLNTELYPESFNAYDSYGEALMAAGKKKAALKAYKKSLKLNPANEQAKRVLESRK